MEKLECIPINIWDDFYDDGYVPEGEKLETNIYIETDKISTEKQREYLGILLEYINKNLNIEDVKLWIEYYDSRNEYPDLIGNPDAENMFFDRYEIKLEGLTHERLNEWMFILEDIDITVDNIPFYIYSES